MFLIEMKLDLHKLSLYKPQTSMNGLQRKFKNYRSYRTNGKLHPTLCDEKLMGYSYNSV